MSGTSSGPERAWTPAFPLDRLPEGGARVFRSGGDQVAVFRLEDGQIFAVDNRCPHEGYPLVQGTCKGAVLTCTWHNYKFDLRDGAAILGDEPVRTYGVRVVQGTVEVDLTAPDLGPLRARLWAGLAEGLSEYEIGRAARDAARLLASGVGPEEIVAFAAVYDAEHGPWGSTHALPVAADVLTLLDRYPGMDAVLPLTQLMEIASFPHIRRPRRPTPEPVDPGPDAIAAGLRLRALIEDEQAEAAEALVRGAVAAGWRRAELEPWFFALCADHFLDFGHALIYQSKVFDLLDAVGWTHAPSVLGGFTTSIALGTREDLLPGWAGARKRLSIIEADLPHLFELQSTKLKAFDTDEVAALTRAVLDGAPADGFQAVLRALQAGAPLARIVDGLSAAASERLLRFTVALDGQTEYQNSWLDVTHLLTFCEAVRAAVARYRSPDVLRLLFQAVHFIRRNAPLDGPRAPVTPVEATPDDVLAHIRAQAAEAAVNAAAGLLAAGGRDALRDRLIDVSVRDPATRAIVVAHVIKTTLAAFREAEAAQDPAPVLALVRFLASPRTERRVLRQAFDAVNLVAHGKIPHDLTG